MGLSSRTAFRFRNGPAVPGPWSPRFLRSSCPQLGGGGVRGPWHPLASPLGGAGRLRSQASDNTVSRRQNRGARSTGAHVPSLACWGSGGGPGLERAPSLRSVRPPARLRLWSLVFGQLAGACGAGPRPGRAGGFGGGA